MHALPPPAPASGKMAALDRPSPENFQDCPAPYRRTLKMLRGFGSRPTPKFFLLPRPEAKKRLPRASLTNMAENRVPKLWFRVQNGPKNANAKSPKIILMPLKCIELTARTCESFSSEMSSDLFPAPTVRRCASQRAPRSPNSNGEQVLRLTRSCHSS